MKSLRFISPDFVLQGELTDYTSLQLTRRHYGTGEFELHFHGHPRLVRAIAIDSRIFSPQAPEKMMVVESIQYREQEGKWVLRGPTLDGLVRRRVCVPPGTSGEVEGERSEPRGEDSPKGSTDPKYALAEGGSAYRNFGYDRVIGDAETVFHHYIAAHAAHPEHDLRTIPGLVLAENRHRGMANVPWQARFDPLADVLEELGAYTGLGWDIRPDYGAKRCVFDVRPGRDVSAGNEAGRTHVVISLRMGNASEMQSGWDASGLRNIAYVGGEGEDEQRFITLVGGDHAGLRRRELWVDAGSASDLLDLQMSGKKRLTDAPIQQSIQATVKAGGAFRYGRDWDLGDVVTFQMDTGLLDARIVEVKETYERGSPVKLAVKAGDGPITLLGAIKRMTGSVAR